MNKELLERFIALGVEHGTHGTVLEPDAIFDRDGWQVWPEPNKTRTFFYEPHVDESATFSFNPWSGTEETYVGPDPSSPPGSNWGWYKDGDGGVSFRVKGKR